MNDIDGVLAYWLEPKPGTEEAINERAKLWFLGGESVDRDIRERFAALVERACAGELDAWTATPRGTLALIILIDQFSRNLYRGRAEAFSHDDKALELARGGYDSGRFAEFDALEHLFAALPFSHAENIEAQRRAVAIGQREALRAQPAWKKMLIGGVDFARKHLDVIARFGRFPHRNAVLGRVSTPDESAYLEYLKFAGQWL